MLDECVVCEKVTSFDLSSLQEEVDHGHNNRWSFMLIALVVGQPLDYNQEVHVAEDAKE